MKNNIAISSPDIINSADTAGKSAEIKYRLFVKMRLEIHMFAPKCTFLKRKEVFNQSVFVRVFKDCIHCLNLIKNLT
jgi:hypothetical protein